MIRTVRSTIIGVRSFSSSIAGVRSVVSLAGKVSGGPPGTVTSFSAGDLSPLFTTSEATVTTTPALTFAAVNQAANIFYAGPGSGSAAAPTFRALVAADIPSLASVYQPLDSDLTAIAALTTTSFGRNLLSLADQAALLFAAGAAASTHVHSGGDITSGTVADARIDAALARLASPALTGNPTAPTQTAGNNTTRLATTAFVGAAVTALSTVYQPVENYATRKVIYVSTGMAATDTRAGVSVYSQAVPFATLAAAFAASSSGDKISTEPGDYTTSGVIGKDGVGWDFGIGTTITRDIVTGSGMWYTAVGLQSYTVGGFADFVQSTSSDDLENTFIYSASTIDFEFRDLSLTSPSTSLHGTWCIYAASTEVISVRCRDMQILGGAANQSDVIYWLSGALNVFGRRCYAAVGNAVRSLVGPEDFSPAYITFDEIESLAGNAVVQQANASEEASFVSAMWVRAYTIKSTGGFSVLSMSPNRLYAEAQKFFGPIGSKDVGGLLYVKGFKISAVANGTPTKPLFFLSSAAGATIWIDVEHFDVSTFAGDSVVISDGTVTITGMNLVGNSETKGLAISGGDVRLVNCVIDTSANSSTDALIVTGGVVHVDNCNLISDVSRKDITRSAGSVVVTGGRGTGTNGAFTTTGTVGYTKVPTAVLADSATAVVVGGITGLGSGVGTWLATPSTTNFFAALTGETSVWSSLATLTNPGAITFLRVNADNTVIARSAANFAADIGITAAAQTVLDDTTVAAMVNTLGGAASTGSDGLVRATTPTLRGTVTFQDTIDLANPVTIDAANRKINALGGFAGGTALSAFTVDSSGNVIAASFAGALTGNVTGNLTGNINGTVGATTPAAGTFTTLTTTGNIELGNASDTTLARSSAGNVSIEGNVIYRAGGTDVAVADGGTGVSSWTAGQPVYASGTTTLAQLAAITLATTGTHELVTQQATGVVGHAVKAITSATANLYEARRASDAVALWYVKPDGTEYNLAGVNIGGTSTPGAGRLRLEGGVLEWGAGVFFDFISGVDRYIRADNSGGVVRFQDNSTTPTGVAIGPASTITAKLEVQTYATTVTTLNLRKQTSQTSDFATWTDTDGTTILGKIDVSGNLKLNVAGQGIYVKEGTNACMGVATLVGGVAVVSNTKVTANSRIFLTCQSLGTIAVPVPRDVTARTAGTSFTITSSNITDTSMIAWEIREPA